jgi:hypothetical protein
MATAKITFHKCIQDSQDYGSNDEHMVSRVFFTFELFDKRFDLHADIKQTVGSEYETGPIEVGRPEGYKGPFNYEAFRNAAEEYYKSLVGSAATGIRIQGGTNIRMRNNTFIQEMTVECEVDEGAIGW